MEPFVKGGRYKVTTFQLFIRSEPGSNSLKLGSLNKDDVVTVIDVHDNWFRIAYLEVPNEQWILGDHVTLIEVPDVVSSTTTNSPPPKTSNANTGQDTVLQEAADEVNNESTGYLPDIASAFDFSASWNNNTGGSDFFNIKSVMGFFGMPYQFMPITDPRIYPGQGDIGQVEGVGYEWAESIIAHMPIVFLAPGRANFMTKFNDEDKANALMTMINTGKNIATGGLDDLFQDEGRYYTFAYADSEYYKYVNPMCRIAAQFLELYDYDQAIGSEYNFANMNWQNVTQSKILNFSDIGSFLSIPFYVNADTSISESFSNSTTQSMIASAANSISDMGRELNFLLGNVQSAAGIELIQNDAEIAKNIENVNNIVNSILGKGNFLSNLASHLTTVAAGGKLQFPEIWSDSSFSRSYSLEFKFISPEPDRLSIYLNVLVPLFHLIGLVAPQSVSTNPNGYTNPFLVRAMYKGFFNIDTGIITSMSVQKGGEGMWTPDGLPTCIEVSIDIKDLYECMSITKTDSTNWSYDTLSNTGQMDYIAGACGINIFKPEISRTILMTMINNFANRASDLIPVNIWGGLQDTIANSIMRMYRPI